MVYWFYTQSHTSEINAIKEQKPQEYMLDLHVQTFYENGKPKEVMHAYSWEFCKNQGYSNLTNPHVTVYKQNGELWYLSSKHALAWHPTIHDKITKVDMLDAVEIERPKQASLDPIKLTTTELQYLPEETLVTTKQFVTLEQPGLVISGYGLTSDLKQNMVELHENITTVYTPN